MWLNGVWLNAEAHKAHHFFHDHWMSQSPTPAFRRFVLIHLYFLPLRRLLFLRSSCCQSAQCLPVSRTPNEFKMKCLLLINLYWRCMMYCIHTRCLNSNLYRKTAKPQKCNWSAVQMSLGHFRTLPTLLHVYSLQNKKTDPNWIQFIPSCTSFDTINEISAHFEHAPYLFLSPCPKYPNHRWW